MSQRRGHVGRVKGLSGENLAGIGEGLDVGVMKRKSEEDPPFLLWQFE